jgi:pyruvate,water dikinase
MNKSKKNILWFEDITKDDIDYVGGKGANLGEMTAFLGDVVPPGFVVTAQAYFDFIDHNNFNEKIREIIERTDTDKGKDLQKAAKEIKELITSGEVPEDLAQEIIDSYHKLGKLSGLKQSYVAIRSSATAEDLPDASFAGQQETYLNVKGEANVVNQIREAWASLFTPRAIFYREEKGFDHFKVGLAAVVQKMIQAEVSGVMFTIDPVTNNKEKIVIEAVWGLGEYIVQGTVTPDHYVIKKKENRIIKIEDHPQEKQLVRNQGENKETKVPDKKIDRQKLNSSDIVELAEIGEKIHQHYYFPQDIEWAWVNNNFYIVQTRPVTTVDKQGEKQESKDSPIKGEVILTGDPASPGIGQGEVIIVEKASEIDRVKEGQVLVTSMTAPDFVPAMKRASAIVTDLGGLTSHAAIVSRELGVPCVVGTKTATEILKEGQEIIVNGESGKIWKGEVTKKQKKDKDQEKEEKIETATNLYVNLAEPSLAKDMSEKDIDGVGLLRAEFMIAEIGKHPQKLIQDGKQEEFIQDLADGMESFCKAFHPRPVVYRATDFKSNEYKNLEGGELFEPEEANPLLGFRGALRYLSLPDVFELELEAIKRVRNKAGLKNLWMMVPFVRTPKELLEVKRIINDYGLHRGTSFKLWMMVEIPSNVILLDEFIKVGIDGVSIGSNDLTMLTLGLDRDNSDIAYTFDERNEAVLWAIKKTIKTCQKHKISSSICGQAPSQYPDLVEKLVNWGITSISVNPDAIRRSREMISWAEKRKIKKKKS